VSRPSRLADPCPAGAWASLNWEGASVALLCTGLPAQDRTAQIRIIHRLGEMVVKSRLSDAVLTSFFRPRRMSDQFDRAAVRERPDAVSNPIEENHFRFEGFQTLEPGWPAIGGARVGSPCQCMTSVSATSGSSSMTRMRLGSRIASIVTDLSPSTMPPPLPIGSPRVGRPSVARGSSAPNSRGALENTPGHRALFVSLNPAFRRARFGRCD
jgi:hypothetical protein